MGSTLDISLPCKNKVLQCMLFVTYCRYLALVILLDMKWLKILVYLPFPKLTEVILVTLQHKAVL